MKSGPSKREVAIVRLPDDVTRGWEWVPIVLICGFMATGGVLHLTGVWTLTLGRRSTTPMPDWLAAGIGVVAVSALVLLVCFRVREVRRARAWRRGVARHASHVTARETAQNMIEAMGLDPEVFASLRHGHFVRAERAMVHQLPWLWVDEATLTTLVRPATTQRIQHRARRAWSPTMIVGAYVGGVMTFVSAFGLIVLALGNQAFGSNWTHWLAMVIVIVAAVVVMALTIRPRLSLAMMSGRAVLMAGPRELGTFDAERAFVVVAPRREHSRTGNSTQIGIRWWFYLPGRRVVYVDDLVAAQTPWAEDLHKLAYTPAIATEHVSACLRCGYPTEGLRDRRCPECGARIG